MSKIRDEEDEDEYFYESLDRLVSSSCSCSTSNSDNENDYDENCSSDQPFPVPKFPMGISKYDIWISEPLSVSERRIRLLHEMGLSNDPALSRAKPGSTVDRRETVIVDFGRSLSSEPLSHQRYEQSSGDSSSIIRSKSDGAVDDVELSVTCPPISQCNSSSSTSASASVCVSASSILSIHSVTQETGSFVYKDIDVVKSIIGGSSVANGISPNKPPSGKNGKRVDDIQCDSTKNSMDFSTSSVVPISVNAGNCEVQEGLNYNGIDGVDEQVYKIKNLDNGKEFIVNEIREDGTWNKLKEVGTGRQLTMEEFEMTVGHSPIVQELMRRQNVEDGNHDNQDTNANGSAGGGSKMKKKGGWLKSIKNVASTMTSYKERRSSDERDTSSDKGGRRSSSATDDSQDVSFHGPERVRVKQYGKSHKELTALYKSQEIQAHNGSIWTIKFSLDGKYLASAGEDCVIHVWQVVESDKKGDLLMEKPEDGNVNLLFVTNGSPEPNSVSPNKDTHLEKKRRGRTSLSRKSLSFDHVLVPDTVFGLTEKPICSFRGHADDVLDLSWSKSQHLLSSSMDKTVRLWHLSSNSCLKVFSHSDFVTCIQFNPVDDRYFISGSLDQKVRIWSIPDRQVVDWNDLHEMVTAACYTPDGQGALVGSYKGSCHLYNTSENKLQQKSQINLQNKKKKSHHKKITGFQFLPGSSSEALITSADSRIRVVDGVDLVHKFKGFHNTNSQISASITANGKYLVSASEDSHVYIWKHEGDSRPNRGKGVTITGSYEHFHSQDVSVAIPWPGTGDAWALHGNCSAVTTGVDNHLDEASTANHPPSPVEDSSHDGSRSASGCTNSPLHGTISSATNSYFFDRISATWPEEKLVLAARNRSPRVSVDFSNGVNENMSAWGMVIVTAGLRGEIRTYQNFGLPFRL